MFDFATCIIILALYKMEEVKEKMKRGLESLSPDQLDNLIWKYLWFLNFGKKCRLKYKKRTVEEKVAKVLELIESVKK